MEKEQEEKLKVDPNVPRPWYFSNATVLAGFLCTLPFVLPLVWLNPYYTSSRKVYMSFFILVFSALAIKGMILGLK